MRLGLEEHPLKRVGCRVYAALSGRDGLLLLELLTRILFGLDYLHLKM